MQIIPADVLPRKLILKFSDQLGKTLLSIEKSCRRPSEKCLIIFWEGRRHMMYVFPADVLLIKYLEKLGKLWENI